MCRPRGLRTGYVPDLKDYAWTAVWKRVGFEDRTLWVDLGGRLRRLYGISTEEHGPAVPYSPDMRVVIERHGALMPAPEYKKGRWLEAFRILLRVPDKQHSLFCAHLCHMFCVHHQTPAMLFSGPPGSGKTTAARLVRELVVDPVGIEHSVAVLPKSADSLRGILAGSPVASFDNVRQISREASDALSGALEGLAMPVGGQKHPVSPGNVRLIMAAPADMPKRLHSLSGRNGQVRVAAGGGMENGCRDRRRVPCHAAAPAVRDI